jgi:hypothetical protein
MLRRTVATMGCTALVLAMAAGIASARTLTVRSDPNDIAGRPDIRKVATDVSPRGVYLGLRAFERVRTRDEFAVFLDTRGDLDFERVVDVLAGRCVVWEIDEGSLGGTVGDRPSRRPGVRQRACLLPRGWFDITKPVRFAVINAEVGYPNTDRAPNRGRYVGL